MKNRLNTKEITTDVLIIGGGTAGCYAALVLSEQKAGRVLIADEAAVWQQVLMQSMPTL